jgi:3-oxoacyl-[acyl-carrier protein] reductase
VPRRILITGTTRGLGRHLAEHYLAAGDAVIGCGRSAPAIEHPQYSHHTADVSVEPAVAAMMRAIRASHGGLDVLINNAGVASMNAFALTPPSTIRRIVDINVTGPMLLTHGAVRLLRGSPAGRIVNITTIAVPMRLAGEAVYAASKGALEIFTRVLAREIGPLGITCNAVGPSLIRTALTNGVPEAARQSLIAAQAITREATCGDVSNVVDFFLRPESQLVTGQVVYLGGFG